MKRIKRKPYTRYNRGMFVVISNQLSTDEQVKIFINFYNREKNILFNKGFVINRTETRSGFNNDDFAKDQYTVIIKFNAIRIPRIIKNYVTHRNKM